jgi:hypothetical protein
MRNPFAHDVSDAGSEQKQIRSSEGVNASLCAAIPRTWARRSTRMGQKLPLHRRTT